MTLEERIKAFQEEYKKLSEKYQLDLQARIQPAMGLIDISPKEVAKEIITEK